ncbi:MAG: response regulator, partial [Eubacterium sp.]|nr:response regulator [Eubacterium sp.]
MHQYSFTLTKESNLEDALSKLAESPFYKKDSVVFAEINDQNRDRKKTGTLVKKLKKRVPGIKIAGLSSIAGINRGEAVNKGIVLTFLIFDSSEVEVCSFDGNRLKEKAIAENFMDKIKNTPDLVSVRVYINAVMMENADDFFETVTIDRDDLTITGAVASADFTGKDADMYLINEDGVMDNGIVAVFFSGKNLYSKASFAQGWEPSGIEHDITNISSDNVIWEIDNMPATELYTKYLGVESNPQMAREIMEFPLMINRNGFQLARGIIGIEGNSGLRVPGGVKKGDKVRLSLAIISDMMRQTRENAKQMAAFQPECMLITVCINRYLYLSEDQLQEINFYSAVLPDLAGNSCCGEILKIGKKIYWLNCALVSLVMREGAADSNPKSPVLPDIRRASDRNNRIPLSDKIARFTRETTAEFVEMLLRNEIDAEKAANEAKSSFLSNMSHEIRTPINSLLGMDEMILRVTNEERTREYANHIKNAGHTLLYLINDILDFSKIEVGKMEIFNEPYSASSMIYDILIMIKGKAVEKELSIDLEIDENIPEGLIGDEIRIRQILLNILTNAIKYTKEGGITFKAYCKRKDDENVDLTFHIIDTGIGIKDENIERLFSPFERIDEDKNRSIEGTGLGLNITKNLLKMMGSKLELKSRYGEGSDFYFTIRQGISDASPIGKFAHSAKAKYAEQSVAEEGYIAPDANVLVVDDTTENLMVVEQLLKRTKINIDTADSGRKCITKASRKKYDIIFMDHRMPSMDGTVAMHIIKENEDYPLNKDTPVIVLTANVVSGMKEKFLKEGFDDYLEKPVYPKELDEMILKYLPPEKVEYLEDGFEEDEELTPERAEILKNIENIVQIDAKSAISVCGGPDTYVKI